MDPRNILTISVFFFTCMPMAIAQDGQTNEYGEIEERQVVINKNLELELPKADRNFEKVPPPINTATSPEDMTYDSYFINSSEIPDITPTLRVLKIKTERPPVLYGNYAKFGFGNYLSPYLAVYLHNTQDKYLSYGASLFHYSAAKGPVDGKNSGDGHSQIRAFGKYMGESASIGGSLGYNVDTYRFYGYDEGIEVDRDTIKQVFNTFNAGLEIANSNPDSDLDLKGTLDFNYRKDNFEVSESAISVGLSGRYPIAEDMGAGMDIDLDFRSYKTDETLSRSLLTFNPYITFERDFLSVKAGINITSNNDTIDNVNAISIFPAVTADYYLSDNLIVFGIFEGGIDKVNFIQITDINPFIGSNTPFHNTIKSLELGGGIRGSLINNLGYKAQATFSGYKNMFFFVNDTIEHNKFNVVYDTDNTTILKLQASLHYSVEKKYGAELGIRYFGYSTRDVDEAWHKPKLNMGISGWYNIYDKIILSTDLNIYSGIKALDPISGETIPLSSALDWNAEIKYQFSDRAGAFILLNNLSGNKYETLYRYPVRSLQVKAGVSVSF